MRIDIYSFITLRKQKFLTLMNFYTFLILFPCSIRVTSERGRVSSSSEPKNIVPLQNETYFEIFNTIYIFYMKLIINR